MTAATLPPDKLAVALWRTARGVDANEAAVGLVIATRVWLRRPAFHRCVTLTQDPKTGQLGAEVNWLAVPVAVARSGAPDSEKQLLLCAAGLAGAGDCALIDLIGCMEHEHLGRVMDAIAHARGWHTANADWYADGTISDEIAALDGRVTS